MPILRRFASLSIRQKLLAMGLMPLLVVLPLLGAVLLLWGNTALDALLVTKVRADLTVAHGYFERVQAEVGNGTRAMADSHALHQALAAGDAAAVQRLLQAGQQRHGLEFLNLLPPPDGAADAAPLATVAVLPADELARIAPALAARVPVPLLTTRNAAPTARTQEDRAMVLIARAPVRGGDGTLLGQVQGGVLLNRNLAFIDHINQIVYPEGSLPFGSRGTATLFLDDVRISTNVRLFDEAGAQDRQSRAIGTRVSQAVREAVLGRGETWLDRAFVVSDWYVSAYLPLADGSGRRVGMLYVGYLEEPFRRMKVVVLAIIGAVFFAVMMAAAWLSLRWARSIFSPIERMTATMREVEAGALQARVGAVGSRDEVGRLAGHLDHLLDTIADKTQALQRSHDELDAKVAERTQALHNAQAQLVKSEKLAAIGQLTAGIAHEVNNPIAVIQGNLDLLRELLGSAAAPAAAELALIDAQIERMRLIVTELLQFARPAEYAGYVEAVAPRQALDDSLVLVNHLLARTRIEVHRDDRATGAALVNRQELQQVLINLMVNAIQVMPEGGELALASRDTDGGQVAITIRDTGPGFSPEVAQRLFQAFVTTKKEGTGLGLWISRSLVERYGGDIRATPRSDGRTGAELTVLLPTDAPQS